MTSLNLPQSVTVVDVTPRDGFQNLPEWIPTENKIRVINALVKARVHHIEVTSFVSPKAVPQLADAAAIVHYMAKHHPGTDCIALTPNLRGARDAAIAGAKSITYVISASESHNLANIRRSHQESIEDLAQIASQFPELSVTLGLTTVFGCPFTGKVPLSETMKLIDAAVSLKIFRIIIADTLGVANPRQTKMLTQELLSSYPHLEIRLHMHDTHGMGLANIFAAYEEGITSFESAAGGLGGCPFAPGAAGNVATEDMINMFERMGVSTGIDRNAYLEAVAYIKEHITSCLPGRYAKARSFNEFAFFDPNSL